MVVARVVGGCVAVEVGAAGVVGALVGLGVVVVVVAVEVHAESAIAAATSNARPECDGPELTAAA